MNWDVKAFATSLAIVYFEKNLSNLKGQWELVVAKSEKWPRNNFAEIRDAMTSKAQQFI